MTHYPLFIKGKWVAGGETRTIRSPYDRRPTADVDFADEAQLESSLAVAHGAFSTPCKYPAHVRAKWLMSLSGGLAARAEEMAQVICEEAGKPIAMARIEVERAVNTFALAAHHVMTWRDEVFGLDVIKYGEGRQCITRRFPVGPLLAITPYNWPLNLSVHKIAPALAVGCPIVMRPASQTPVSAMLLAELMGDAGVPAGFYNVVPCESKLVERLARDPRIKMISFTGSPEVGWKLKQQHSQKRVALELGGNAACIIEPDTQLGEGSGSTIARLALGCFGYAGQICISIQRLYLHEAIHDAFVATMTKYLREDFKTGDPRDEKVLCGPLIDKAAADRVMAWLEQATARGARVLAGGRRLGDNLIEPTLMEKVSADLPLQCKEVFGPVATLTTYRDFDEALALANASEYGINCGVFTNDVRKAHRAFETLEVGCVVINDYPTFRVDNMPYGGVKQSGFGREGVAYAMEEMTEIRAMIVNLNQ